MSTAPARTQAAQATQRRVVLLVGCAISAWLLFLPAKQLVSEKLLVHRLETRLGELERENARLEQEARRLEDSGEMELLARERLGWVKPGERAYLVVPEPTPPPVSPPQGPSWWTRARESVVRLIRGGG